MPGENKHHIYLLPGLGADGRLFKNLRFDPAKFDVHVLEWEMPEKGQKMRDFAQKMAKKIDSDQKYSIIGTSLGGMVAVEMAEFLTPEQVILVASAKHRNELPPWYRFMKTLPVHRLVPGWVLWLGSFLAQPLFEPDRKKDAGTFKAMLKDKSPRFLYRATRLIAEWDRTAYPSLVYHIHGDNDHTLPVKYIEPDEVIKGGSHMMVLTNAQEVMTIIKRVMV